MTDLEITRLCAEAMDFPEDESATHAISYRQEGHIWIRHEADAIGRMYHPLHDDAQAMALVKKMEIDITYFRGSMIYRASHYPSGTKVLGATLNMSVCECVAKMQAQK